MIHHGKPYDRNSRRKKSKIEIKWCMNNELKAYTQWNHKRCLQDGVSGWENKQRKETNEYLFLPCSSIRQQLSCMIAYLVQLCRIGRIIKIQWKTPPPPPPPAERAFLRWRRKKIFGQDATAPPPPHPNHYESCSPFLCFMSATNLQFLSSFSSKGHLHFMSMLGYFSICQSLENKWLWFQDS